MAADFEGLCPLLQVFDMPQSVDFYCRVLGFTLENHSPIVTSPQGDYFHWCSLRRGSVGIMLNTAYDEGERPAQPDAARAAAHADIALYFDSADADALFHHVCSLGARVVEQPFVTPYGMKRFTIADPDGYNLSFHGAV